MFIHDVYRSLRTEPLRAVFARIQPLAIAAFASLALACSPAASGDRGDAGETTGRLELALTTTIDGDSYLLQNAVFEITGAEAMTLDGTESSETLSLSQELPVGDYSVLLRPGWQLALATAPDEPLAATLLTSNPLPFSVLLSETTALQYRFSVLEPSELGMAKGAVEVSFDVMKEKSRALVFSEVMSNPAALADTAGEWVELSNVGKEAISLAGCSLLRDGKGFTFDVDVTVQPGHAVALANGETPGFVPAAVYKSVTLPNSAVFVLALQCQGTILDQITVDPSTWPGGNGVAASLSPAVRLAESNDDPAQWCNATTSYATDLGTPGAENPACP